MITPNQMKKFYICADVSHTHPAEAGYLFPEDMQSTNCAIAVWLRYNVKSLLTHGWQYHEEVDSVGCSRCPIARRASIKFILFSR